MAETYKPTRSALLAVKKKIAFARRGHNLLKKKRDGLMLEFFKILDSAKDMKNQIHTSYAEAREKLAVALCVEGVIGVRSAAFATTENPQVELTTSNMMGIVMPKIKGMKVRKAIHERGYGVIGTSSYINEAARAYEVLIEEIMKTAEVETTMKMILAEIEQTKRRVNALEFNLIPNLEHSETFIQSRLEEMERENIFRLKRFKQKEKAQAEV